MVHLDILHIHSAQYVKNSSTHIKVRALALLTLPSDSIGKIHTVSIVLHEGALEHLAKGKREGNK